MSGWELIAQGRQIGNGISAGGEAKKGLLRRSPSDLGDKMPREAELAPSSRSLKAEENGARADSILGWPMANPVFSSRICFVMAFPCGWHSRVQKILGRAHVPGGTARPVRAMRVEDWQVVTRWSLRMFRLSVHRGRVDLRGFHPEVGRTEPH